jgi:hypothetical protein
MPKRIFWLTAGVAIGAGSSLWAERKVRRSVQQAAARLQPDALVVEVGRSARQVAGTAGERVRLAVSSGRDEMQRREEELWAELAAQGVETALPPAPPLPPPPPSVSGVSGVSPRRAVAGPAPVDVPAVPVESADPRRSRGGRRQRKLRVTALSNDDKPHPSS